MINKSQVGLPPIRTGFNYTYSKLPNLIEKKNKNLIKDYEKERNEFREAKTYCEERKKSQYKRMRDLCLKQNEKIENIRKEIYGELPKEKTFADGFISNTKYDKLNEEYHGLNAYDIESTAVAAVVAKSPQKVEMNDVLVDDNQNEDELHKILNEINEFDINKYVKDSELKEAIYVLKSKYDNENKKTEKEVFIEKINTTDINKKELNQDKIENLLEDIDIDNSNRNKSLEVLPVWNSSLKADDEPNNIATYKVAEQLLESKVI